MDFLLAWDHCNFLYRVMYEPWHCFLRPARCRVSYQWRVHSLQGMPEDFKYDAQKGDAFISREDEEEIEIREGCVVRLRIMGVQVEASEIVSGRV